MTCLVFRVLTAWPAASKTDWRQTQKWEFLWQRRNSIKNRVGNKSDTCLLIFMYVEIFADEQLMTLTTSEDSLTKNVRQLTTKCRLQTKRWRKKFVKRQICVFVSVVNWRKSSVERMKVASCRHFYARFVSSSKEVVTCVSCCVVGGEVVDHCALCGWIVVNRVSLWELCVDIITMFLEYNT